MTDEVTLRGAGARCADKASPDRLALVIALAAFAGLAIVPVWGLGRNAQEIPSALIGKPVPDMGVPPVKGRTLGLSSGDFRGDVSLVNVFASWCVVCRDEHPLFLRIAAEAAVPLHGLNYKDWPDDGVRWLDPLGERYTPTGTNLNGRVAIDRGVYGVPETFVVGANWRIAYKHIGLISEKGLRQTILPLVAWLRAEAQEQRP